MQPTFVAPDLLVAGLVDLDATFLIQLGIFLVLMVAMKLLVFDPFLGLATARDEATRGAKARAVAARERAAELG